MRSVEMSQIIYMNPHPKPFRWICAWIKCLK